jgi:mono/diheme cytochrome c family protein
MFRFLFGLMLGLILVPAGVYYWFNHGAPPVAVADKPFPYEREFAHTALDHRIQSEVPRAVGAEANEATFVAGARVYRESCAFCHGVYDSPSIIGKNMYPSAPSLWEKHAGEVVGVSDDPPAETYWKVANGIRLTGMPSYKLVLSDTQMWQVSVLLANADKPLPPAALSLLKEPLAFIAAKPVAVPMPAAQ